LNRNENRIHRQRDGSASVTIRGVITALLVAVVCTVCAISIGLSRGNDDTSVATASAFGPGYAGPSVPDPSYERLLDVGNHGGSVASVSVPAVVVPEPALPTPEPARRSEPTSVPAYDPPPLTEVEQWICDAGWPDCAKALRVARCESGPDYYAGIGAHAGTFQIAPLHAGRFALRGWDYWTDGDDYYKNSVVALSIYSESGWRPWPYCGYR
jgi:hypothetical protein